MVVCLSQQCGVVCAAHGEGGGGAAVAEDERCAARTEGCNIGEGEGGSAAFGGEDNGLDALRAEVGQIGKDAMQGRRLLSDIDVENIVDLVQLDQLDVLDDVGLSRVEDTQTGGDAAVAVVGDIAVLHLMKELLFLYQKHTALEMIQKGYHDAILSMIRDDLGGAVPEYKSDNASAYIAEHLNRPMLKNDLKEELIRVLGMTPAKGRSSKETVGKLLLNRELQKYGVEIISDQGNAGEWRNKTFWMLVELT